VSLPGVTADAGFLIALERSKARALALLRSARLRRSRIVVPVAVLAEWWRGSPDQARILRPFNVEPMSESLAKTAGEALAAVSRATVVDAIVMASAASRGDIVYTSDFDDLSRLREHFRAVRVLGV
jgi:predicted nucleic acid-binding protein